MNEMRTEARQKLGTFFLDPGGKEENRPQIALTPDEDRAIDLSCRACGALALGAGLGFPEGTPLLSVFTPNLRSLFEVQKLQDGRKTIKTNSRKYENFHN